MRVMVDFLNSFMNPFVCTVFEKPLCGKYVLQGYIGLLVSAVGSGYDAFLLSYYTYVVVKY